MEEFFKSCEGSRNNENITHVSRVIQIGHNLITVWASKEIMETANEMLNNLPKIYRNFPRENNYRIKTYGGILCMIGDNIIGTEYDKPDRILHTDNVVYFIENFETLNDIYTIKKDMNRIEQLSINDNYSFIHSIKRNIYRPKINICIKSTNIEFLKIDIDRLNINKIVARYPMVCINNIMINTNYLSDGINSVKCNEIYVNVIPETIKNLSMISDTLENVILQSPNMIQF